LGESRAPPYLIESRKILRRAIHRCDGGLSPEWKTLKRRFRPDERFSVEPSLANGALARASSASCVVHRDADLHVTAIAHDVGVLHAVCLALELDRLLAPVWSEAALDRLQVVGEFMHDDRRREKASLVRAVCDQIANRLVHVDDVLPGIRVPTPDVALSVVARMLVEELLRHELYRRGGRRPRVS